MGNAAVPLLLMVGVLTQNPGSEGGKKLPLPVYFLYQEKTDCLFPLDGRQRVRYLDRYFYDRQEFVRFDSHVGKHVAITEFGQPEAKEWNSNKITLMMKRAEVDRFCAHNYEAAKMGFVVGRRTKPTVTISPTKMDPASPNTILLCIATGFYPVEIEVQWLKNGWPEEEGVAFGEELQNGDWTYQLQVMLETQPQRGDVYTCQVGHASLEAPITVQWAMLIQPPAGHSGASLWTPRLNLDHLQVPGDKMESNPWS